MANPFLFVPIGTPFVMCPFNDFFCREVRYVNNYEFKCIENGKIYESPCVEIVGIDAGQSVLCASVAGEAINEWEEM